MRQTSKFIQLVFILALLAIPAAAQSTNNWQWRALTPASGDKPEARRNGVAVHDTFGKRIIVFGGSGNSGFLNDAWAFSLETRVWTKLQTTGTPPSPRHAFDGIYDPVGQQLVIYSGQGNGLLNDTWTLNLTTLQWRDVSPALDSARPKRRYGSAGVFDPVTRSLVSFAGFTSEAGRFNDTQSFGLGGNAWQDWSPGGTRPKVRCLLTGAFDRANRRMIVYAGQNNGWLDDLWSFDLATRTWTELTPAVRPTGRWFASLAVDKDSRVLMFGGTGAAVYGDLWSFDQSARQWTQLQIAGGPSARFGAQGAYLESEDRWILFGGAGSELFNDVWELRRASAPAAVTAVSAASFAAQQLAPESIIAVFGANLATATQAATTAQLPTVLAGASVRVKDNAGAERNAPLFFVSPTQLNALIPAGTLPGAATLNVYNGADLVASGPLTIATVAPSIFSANASGTGVAAAVVFRLRADGSQSVEPVAEWNATLNRFVAMPIDVSAEQEQVYLILFGTGFRYNTGLANVTASVGGTDAPLNFAGAQGSLAGLDQANVRLPRALAGRGVVNIELRADGKAANVVEAHIR